MKTYLILLLVILILVFGKKGLPQYTGIYSSKSLEFVDFSNHGEFYALIENGTKISNSRLEFDYGVYTISKDTLHFFLDNNPKNKLANIVTFDKHASSEYFSLKFVCIDKLPGSNLKLDVYYKGNDSTVLIWLKDGEKIKLHDLDISKINFTYTHNLDIRELVKFSLLRDDLLGNNILIQSIQIKPSIQNKKFLINNASISSISIIGPFLQDYKIKNRIKWFQSFRNWPWEWSLQKEHWYDPLERKLFFQQSKNMYFFSHECD